MVKQLLTASGIFASLILSAQKNFWNPVQNKAAIQNAELFERTTTPKEFKLFSLNLEGIRSELSKAPSRESSVESFILKFPTASGQMVDYIVKEAPVMAKELSEKYPGISSYVGYQKNNPENSIRFSISPYDGINVMYFENAKISYLDTYTKDLNHYIVYDRSSLPTNPERFNCDYDKYNLPNQETVNPISLKAPFVQDGKMRTYRLALAGNFEYSRYHYNRAGLALGTVEQKKAAVLAAMNASMTRVNGVYEKTVSLTMVMVPNNDQIIFVENTNDGYTNGNGGTMLSENQTVCDTKIGSANYDIGHVFSTGGGGVAYLRSPCGASKAAGVTGSSAPINDAFNIDYVAHEMGHQFGGNHTFRANTSDAGSCSGNSNTSTAVEPGSGTTIMAYAGICTSTYDIQAHSDPYFHSVSVNEMYSFITRTTDCSVKTANNNNTPVADAGLDYTIPYGTAFVLTGSGSDPDGDAVTYLWEQTNTASITANPQPPTATTVQGTVFRSYNPKTTPERYFPDMSYIAGNNLTPTWEVIPSVARTLNFSLLVNDNKATGNQSARDLMVVTVANTGPFKVTSQTSAANYNGGSQMTVTWDVAGTNAAPINTQNVQILLSADNGLTYPIVLASSVPNSGSASVTLPNDNISNARIMVKAVGNIFLALNTAGFNINKVLAVNESAFNKGFSVFPNPAKGEVNISLDKINKNAAYQIFDLSGKLLVKGNLENEKNTVNIASLKTGTYRLVVSNNGETTSKNPIVK